MKDVKEANHIELAEYIVATNIADEPVFALWVPYTLKKKTQDCIKSLIKMLANHTKIWSTTLQEYRGGFVN